MQKLAIGMQRDGFTLIEILVVILIISIAMSFALFSIGDFGKQRALMHEGHYFNHYLQLVKHEAILESQTLGIRVKQHGYEVLRLRDHHWQTLKSHAFRFHPFQHQLIAQI